MADDAERDRAILAYLERGWRPVPLRPSSKDAYRKGWQSASFTPSDFATDDNVGINWEGSGVVDVDLDITEARMIAPHVLGAAPGFGREGAPGGHLLIRCADAPSKIVAFKLANAAAAAERLGLKATTDDKLVICEARAKGQTMAPPSIHPRGEPVTWNGGAIPPVDAIPAMLWPTLLSEVRLIAFLAVILRAYPREAGSRNDIAMALAGALLSFGVDAARVPSMVELVAKLADDKEADGRKRTAEATATKHRAGDKVTGLPRLCDLLGIEDLEADFRKWFGVKTAPIGSDADDVQAFFAARGGARMIRWNGEWLTYDDGAYRAFENEGVRAEIYRMRPAWRKDDVDDCVDMLKAHCFVDRNRLTPPCWIGSPPASWGEATPPDPRRLVVMTNGMVDIDTGGLHPHTDEYFTRVALPFPYQPDAPAPVRWLGFLAEVFPNEPDARDTLQVIFGYLLMGATDQQIIPALVGPTRSGKGTIARILVRLLGSQNVCAPTVDQLGQNFGLQGMIGKSLALIADARIGAHTNKARVTEVLLRISGEDAMSVPRKNLADWEGTLGCRILFISNEPPGLNDPSGALAARWRVLQMRQSFVGREDRGLDAALSAEMPGILMWAIEGARKLRHAGRIEQPASATEILTTMRRLASVVVAFVEDECELRDDGVVATDALYAAFIRWCREQGVRSELSKELFGKELTTAYASVRKIRKRTEASRGYAYAGVSLREITGEHTAFLKGAADA